ncbi:YceI family protein [Fretibacter rubidus]|uniref:YceI family protein n=1 Tax=Fretibacter rubidus TaxID=570162 RepID=UPI00352B18FB
MKLATIIPSIATIALLSACGAQVDAAADATKNAADKATNVASDMASKAADAVTPGPDISTLPAGIYKSENTHAYVAFSYVHQGYSKPILMWDKFDATVNLNADSPESSSVDVTIDAASIDGGSDIWNDHLMSEDWFDAANHPTITFKSTDVAQSILGNGTLTGDLTIKGVTHPVTLDVKLNKVGEHFRSKKPMFGISATGTLQRADFGMDKYLATGADVDLMLEIEFQKED